MQSLGRCRCRPPQQSWDSTSRRSARTMSHGVPENVQRGEASRWSTCHCRWHAPARTVPRLGPTGRHARRLDVPARGRPGPVTARAQNAVNTKTPAAEIPCVNQNACASSTFSFTVPSGPRSAGRVPVSFYLRRGKTPKRVHADLDGLKDDELGRGGPAGRPRIRTGGTTGPPHRTVGLTAPHRCVAMSSELKPGDSTDAHGSPPLMFSNDDCQILLLAADPSRCCTWSTSVDGATRRYSYTRAPDCRRPSSVHRATARAVTGFISRKPHARSASSPIPKAPALTTSRPPTTSASRRRAS